MGEDELQNELGPARGADLVRPARQRHTLEPADQRLLAERPVDHHGDAAVARQRQEPLLGLSIEDVVGELHEIERVLAHDPLEQLVPAPVRGGDADMPDLARGLHGRQRLQMLAPVD